MAFFDDWKDATQRDTPARSVSQGITAGLKPLSGNFGSAQQPDIPAADAAAYKRQGSEITAGLPASTMGGGATSAPKPFVQPVAANLPSTNAARPATDSSAGDLGGFKASATSQPGVSRVTGGGLLSPLYTNVGGSEKTVSDIGAGLFDGSPPPRPAPTSPLFAGRTGIAGPSQAAAPAAPAINPNYTTGIASGLPENLQRFSAANQTRQSLIDAQPRGGIGILPDRGADEWNKRMAREGAIDDMIYEMRKNPQIAGAMSGALAQTVAGDTSRDVEGIRQQGITAGLNLQRRGQDLNYGAQMAQQGLTARSQELNAARDNARLSIDMGRFGLEQSNSMRQQAAQDNLARAMESGDQNAITRARSMAAAAGVRLDTADSTLEKARIGILPDLMKTYTEQRPTMSDGKTPIPFEQWASPVIQMSGVNAGSSKQPPSIQPGYTEGGYRFNGGDPANKASWSKL